MYVLIAALDMDGCLYHDKGPEGFLRAAQNLARKNASKRRWLPLGGIDFCDVDFDPEKLVAGNQLLLKHLLDTAGETEAKKIQLTSVSSRQDPETDLVCGYPLVDPRRCSGSSASGLKTVAREVKKGVSSDVTVEIDTHLTADSDNGFKSGYTFELMDDLVNRQFDSPERKNKAFRRVCDHGPKVEVFDEYKTTLILQKAARASALHPNDDISFCIFEDRFDILTDLEDKLSGNTAAIPKNVTIKLYHYDGTSAPSPTASIQGTGPIPRPLTTSAAASCIALPLSEDVQIERILKILKNIINSEEWERQGKVPGSSEKTKVPAGVQHMRRSLDGVDNLSYEKFLQLVVRPVDARQHSLAGGFFRKLNIRSPLTSGLYKAMGLRPFLANGSISRGDLLNRIEENLKLYAHNHFPEALQDNSPAESVSANESTPSLRSVRS